MKDYIKKAMRTNTDGAKAKKKLQNEDTIQLLHSFIGLSTEANELLDMLKKHIYYGKEIDEVNIIEELGDACWFIALGLDTLGMTFDEVMKRNIKKLQVRYPDKFNEKYALNRNLKRERKVLGKKKKYADYG